MSQFCQPKQVSLRGKSGWDTSQNQTLSFKHDVPYFQSSYLVSSVVNAAVMSQPVSTLMLVKEREEVLAINDKICFFLWREVQFFLESIQFPKMHELYCPWYLLVNKGQILLINPIKNTILRAWYDIIQSCVGKISLSCSKLVVGSHPESIFIFALCWSLLYFWN